MARKLLEPGSIDEARLRTAMGERRYDQMPPVDARPVLQSGYDAGDFEDCFMQPFTSKSRGQIWIDETVKEQLEEVVRLIGHKRTTLQSYVNMILRDHIVTYRDEINRIYQRRVKKTVL